MMMSRSQRVTQRLAEIDRDHRTKFVAAHNEFRKACGELLKEYSISYDPQNLMAVQDWPAEIHDALAEHKQKLVDRLLQIDAEKESSSVEVKPRINYLRIN